MAITIKTPEQVAGIRRAARIVAEVLDRVPSWLRPGMTTAELNEKIDTLIRQRGGVPAFLGYRGFPAASCISLNHEVVHGIPSPLKRIREGDLVKVDVGVIWQGYYGDAARTYAVGEVSPLARELMRVTERALYRGIEQARPGRRLYDISAAIQDEVERHGFHVVRELTGHGVGLKLHEEPMIPNFREPSTRRIFLKPGMVLALEPMVNIGTPRVYTLEDHWTVVTADGSLSAHFEHTVLITKDQPEILTRLD